MAFGRLRWWSWKEGGPIASSMVMSMRGGRRHLLPDLFLRHRFRDGALRSVLPSGSRRSLFQWSPSTPATAQTQAQDCSDHTGDSCAVTAMAGRIPRCFRFRTRAAILQPEIDRTARKSGARRDDGGITWKKIASGVDRHSRCILISRSAPSRTPRRCTAG